MKILLIGPQGSGKSTQAESLAKDLGLPKITVGDIFRQIAAENSNEGQRIKQILDSGHLVDDQTVSGLVKNRLNKEDVRNGFIMDGYPRTMEQLNLFDPGFEKVIYLEIPREGVVSRLMKRGRTDDTQELINRRLDLYYQQTQPLLEHYKQIGALVTINAAGNIEQVQQAIREIF